VVAFEASPEGTIWVPLLSLKTPAYMPKTLWSGFIRARGKSGFAADGAVASVGAPAAGIIAANTPVDVPTADGAGVPSNISSNVSPQTIYVGGENPLEGIVHIEIGPSGGPYVPLVSFNRGGLKTIAFVAEEVRTRLSGFTGTVPVALEVHVCADTTGGEET
jgi:hypothetical protein